MYRRITCITIKRKNKMPQKLTHIHTYLHTDIHAYKIQISSFQVSLFEYGLIYEIFHHCTKSIVLCQAILLHFQFHFLYFYFSFLYVLKESSNNYYTMISRFPISKTGCVCMYVQFLSFLFEGLL